MQKYVICNGCSVEAIVGREIGLEDIVGLVGDCVDVVVDGKEYSIHKKEVVRIVKSDKDIKYIIDANCSIQSISGKEIYLENIGKIYDNSLEIHIDNIGYSIHRSDILKIVGSTK